MKAKIDLLVINDLAINEKAKDKQNTVFNNDLTKLSFPNDEQNEEKFIELKFKQNFEVFPICNIAELMKQMGQHHSKKHRLRYLVDKEWNLWFALEGIPNEKIPAHYQMVSLDKENAECITAGNMKIKAGSLCMINHKSGFFKPSFDSMKWALAILIYHKVHLPPSFLTKNISLEKLNSKGGVINTCNLAIEELKIVTAPYIDAELDGIADQPTEKKQVQNDFISILSPAVSPVKRPVYKASDFPSDWLSKMLSPFNSPVKKVENKSPNKENNRSPLKLLEINAQAAPAELEKGLNNSSMSDDKKRKISAISGNRFNFNLAKAQKLEKNNQSEQNQVEKLANFALV